MSDVANLADLGDMFSDAGSSASPPSCSKKRQKVVDVGLGEKIIAENVKKAKHTVNEAMKNDASGWTAVQLAYLITSGKLHAKRPKQEGQEKTLPPSCNKYHLLGADRLRELLSALHPQMDKGALQVFTVADLNALVRYALCLGEKCALPAKLFSKILEEAQQRYRKLGGNRLANLVFVRRGDEGHVYYSIEWPEGGCFKLYKKAKKYVSIQHVSGVTVPIKPPVEDSYVISMNQFDRAAVLVSPNHQAEIRILKLFEVANKADALPLELEETRVGLPKAVAECPAPLAIEDAKPEPAPPNVVGASSSSSGAVPAGGQPRAGQAAPAKKGQPKGCGSGPRPVRPPPRKK